MSRMISHDITTLLVKHVKNLNHDIHMFVYQNSYEINEVQSSNQLFIITYLLQTLTIIKISIVQNVKMKV